MTAGPREWPRIRNSPISPVAREIDDEIEAEIRESKESRAKASPTPFELRLKAQGRR